MKPHSARIPLSIEVLPIDEPLIHPVFVSGDYIPREVRNITLAVYEYWTFEEVCKQAANAYRLLYNEGKKDDWQVARITTPVPYHEIDTQLTVEELCADEDFRAFVIHTTERDPRLSLPQDLISSTTPSFRPYKRTFQDTQSPNQPDAADDLKRKKLRITTDEASYTALDSDQPSLSEAYDDQRQHHKSSDQTESSQSLPQNHGTANPGSVVTAAIATSQPSSSNRTIYSVVFSPNDLANMRVAARNRIASPDVFERYFSGKGLDYECVVKQYSEVKHQVIAEKKREREEATRQAHIQKEDASGQPSSSDDQPYTRIEDDLLLAARLERADMARIAIKHFPRRAAKGVVTRGKNLYHDLERAVQKECPGETIWRDTITAAVGSERCESIMAHRVVARASKREFEADRQAELAEEQKEIQLEKEARARRLQHHQNLKDIQANARARESRQRLSEDLAQRRADEDTKNQRRYQRALADWEVRAARARKTHSKIPPRPKAPTASTIGLEIASSQDLQRRTSSSRATLDDWVDRTPPVAGPSTASVDPQTRTSGGLPTPKKSPGNSNPARSSRRKRARPSKSKTTLSDDASVMSANYEDFTNAQALRVLRQDQVSTGTQAQAHSRPALATQASTAQSQPQMVDNAEASSAIRQNEQQVVANAPEQASVPKQANTTTQAHPPQRASASMRASTATAAPAPEQASVPMPVITTTTAPTSAQAAAPEQASPTTRVPPITQSEPSKPAAKSTSVATASAPLKSTNTAANTSKSRSNGATTLAASRTQLHASQDEPVWQQYGHATHSRLVEFEDEGNDNDEYEDDEGEGSDYNFCQIGETAEQRSARIRLENQKATKEHDARSKARYQAMLARMQAKEEARRPVGDPHLVLVNDHGDTESADEEICRFLDTGLTVPAEDAIASRPSVPVVPHEPLRRQSAAAPKPSQSTLGSARPPFPSSGIVRSASPSGKSGMSGQNKREVLTNTQSTRLEVENPKENENIAKYEDENGDEENETHERTLEDIRAYYARMDKVRHWLRNVEPANLDQVDGAAVAT